MPRGTLGAVVPSLCPRRPFRDVFAAGTRDPYAALPHWPGGARWVGGAGSGGGARPFPWLRPRGRARRGRAGLFLPREPRERQWARSGTSGHPAGRHGPQRSSGLPRRGVGAPLEEALEAPGPWPALRLLRAGGRPGRRGHEQGGKAPAGVSAGTAGGSEGRRGGRWAGPRRAGQGVCAAPGVGLGWAAAGAELRAGVPCPSLSPRTLLGTSRHWCPAVWELRVPEPGGCSGPGHWLLGTRGPFSGVGSSHVLCELGAHQCLGARLGAFGQSCSWG